MSAEAPPLPEPPDPDNDDPLPSSTEMFRHALPELRRIAGFITGRRSPIRPTELVQLTWVKLSRKRRFWRAPSDFTAYARTVMQNISRDENRRERRERRGGEKGRGRPLDSVPALEGPTVVPRIESDEELRVYMARIAELRRVNAKAADVIELVVRGLTTTQAAQSLGLSVRSAERARRVALAWMKRMDPGKQQ